MSFLEPNEYGNYPCPYCNYILTALLKEWIPAITDYICHHCQIGFKVKMKEGIDSFV